MFISSSDLYKKWAFYASAYVRRAKQIETIDYPCNLSVVAYYSNNKHRQDLDNVIASVSDILEDCEVIKNDNLFHSYDGSKKIYDAEIEYIEIKISKII